MKNVLRSNRFCFLLAFLALAVIGFPASAQEPPTIQFLHLFTGGTAGADPVTSPVQMPSGNLAGVTFGAAQFQSAGGMLYTVTPNGGFTTRHNFPAKGGQGGVQRGGREFASLMQASDGNFFGTFPVLGEYDLGTVYRVTPSGVFTQIHVFGDGSDGAFPQGPLVEAFDGYLYGTTQNGPPETDGNIFRVGLDGSFSTVFVFPQAAPGNGPSSGLVLGPDGGLYGFSEGLAIYRYDPVADTLADLFVGAAPSDILTTTPVLGLDNRLYFLTLNSNLCGCQFGALASVGLDGSGPEFPLVFTEPVITAGFQISLAGTGSETFYAVDQDAGPNGLTLNVAKQTVARYPLAGVGTRFNGALVQVASGSLAGTTYSSGDDGKAAGTLFLLEAGESKPAPFIVGFQPQSASVGQTVTVWGRNFVGTTGVTLNGASTNFQTAASGFVSFTVPEGAASSAITVTNAGGSTTSSGTLVIQ